MPARGIGLAIARALAGEGASVVAGALHGSASSTSSRHSSDVRAGHGRPDHPDGPAELVARRLTELGGIDILVNNVGAVRPRLEGFLALTDDDWDWTLTINFLAAVRTMRAASRTWPSGRDANIVTISSVNAFLPDPGVIDYSAAKGALTNLCKSLSKELGPGIRVNTISPGPVRTDLWLGATASRPPSAEPAPPTPARSYVARRPKAPTGRFTYPSEVADLVLFLASDRAANITGSDLRIDGGLVDTL